MGTTTDLEELEEKSNNILYRCQTVFPFKFFPTTVEITQTRIDIKYGIFIFSNQIIPVLISDLVNVVVTTNLFFSNLRFEMKILEKSPPSISYLLNDDALRIKQIVTGLIEANSAQIPLKRVNLQERDLLQSIGTTVVGEM
jgi:hypothetical protein